MTTVTTATAPVVAEPIPTPYKELESTVQSTPPTAEQVPEEETGTDSATGEGMDTQDITVNDVAESAEGDEGTKAQPSTDSEELVDTRPSELDEPTPNEPTPTNSEVTGESETKQEDEKPLFSEAIGHGEHPEGTDSSPSLQPQTETFQAQPYSQAQSQVPYTQTQTYPLSHAPSPSHTQVPAPAQVLTHASYAQSQQQLPYPQQQAQPQLPSPQQQPQPQATMQYGQPYPQQAQATMQYGQPYPQQAQQQTQQQAPYTQPYPPQQQASYTQVQVFTNSQPNERSYPIGGDPTKSKVVAGLLAIFLGLFGVHKFYLGQTNAGVSILLLNFILLLLSILLFWTILIPLFIYSVYAIEGFVFLIEGIIYFVKSDEEFQRDCVRG